MKTSAIPAIRVEPQLREQLAHVLREGETLSAFVEASVRESVHRRMEQDAFVKRGLASLAKAKRTGDFVSVDEVVQGLEKRLAAARETMRPKSSVATKPAKR
jgi:predicted transcriptional regulator